ncbi:basic salivary proline-rich protein 2-like isoform X2 [Saccostrea echinata]|uniref:basic salivary proline-rich protein 2-like isoform X2 n=1 Tax=Saccostrea echinata TaxID=191078 RepID=UPI002A822247|nr:basic salivary proline-rich protein 2-like isoform X2 [Saccostrea echinata]
MSRPPRKLLPLPDSDAPKSGRPPPPVPSDDSGPPPPVPGRRAPPPIPPQEAEKHSDSSYESDSEFEGDSDESYEKMRDKLSPPAIPNRGYRQPDDQEVYDDGEAGEIYEEDVEIGPEEVYDDGEIGQEVYNVPEEETPPPIPATPRRELPPPPPQTGRPPPPIPSEPQDVYEVEPEPDPVRPQTPPDESGESIYEMEPEVSDQPSKGPPELPGRPPVPAPPQQETYEMEDEGEQENYDEFSLADEMPQDTYDEFEAGPPGEVYEDVDDENQPPRIPGRPIPPPPPSVPSPSKPTPPPPKNKATPAPRPTPKLPLGGGPMGFDISAIKGVQLKKVGLPTEDKQKAKESDKIYDEDGGVKSAFEKFKQKGSGVEQIDFRNVLSKAKTNTPPNDTGNKPSIQKTLPSTPLKPPVNKWGLKSTQGEQSSLEQSNVTKKFLPPVPHKPLEEEQQTVSPQKSPIPFKPKHNEHHPLPEVPTPTVRLSPLPDSSQKKEVPVPPRQTAPSHDTPPIPAVRRSPSPSKESPPPPPPAKSVPDKPPVPYSQVKPTVNVANGTKMGIEEDHNSSENEDDDIYDDAISNRDPLLGEPWYFKTLKDRKTGDKLLKKVGKDGTFLIRESTKQGNFQPYTMMVLFQNNVYNLKIRVRADGKMALGEEKPDEMSFMDVQKLVKYHRETEVILVGHTGQHKTLLKYSPPQNSI